MLGQSSCANIIPPGGGPRDSIPPVLIASTPKDSSLNVKSNRIVLNFDEYVDLDPSGQQNIIVSPNPVNQPIIDHRLKTITIRLRDSLQPNTTYSINFGNAIKDVNEGNVFKDFTYVFSTGNKIDEGILSGKVMLAETGKIDSALIVVLHRNLHDTAIIKLPPVYYASLDGQGNFHFRNLAPGRYAVYAVPNGFTRRYDDSTKLFAFLDTAVTITEQKSFVNLFAYQEVKKGSAVSSLLGTSASKSGAIDKRLVYTSNGGAGHDILQPVLLNFNKRLNIIDTNAIRITDTSYQVLQKPVFAVDTSKRIITISYPWQENTNYRIIIPKTAFADSAGNALAKTDTLRLHTKKETEYGSIRFRFSNVKFNRNPVIQLWTSDKLVESFPLTSAELYRKLYVPGTYEIKILYDANKNGVWDPGHFPSPKKQPEIVEVVQKELTIRANWDNEYDIKLKD